MGTKKGRHGTWWRMAAAGTVILLVAGACGDAAETNPETVGPAPVATGEGLTTTLPAATTAPATTATSVTTTTPVATTAPATSTAPITTTSVPEPPRPPATATTAAGGSASDSCFNGWKTPAPGTPQRTAPLDLIRRDMGLAPGDLFVIDEMRYFLGPEDVTIIEPRRDVERWYVKGYLEGDPTFAGRWLVRRVVGNEAIAGVGAVAPYDTTGYEPGTWFSFVGESDSPGAYPGLPGMWWGVPEDPFAPAACTADNGPFGACSWGVGGCGAGTADVPACSGPPPEVMGCLAGT